MENDIDNILLNLGKNKKKNMILLEKIHKKYPGNNKVIFLLAKTLGELGKYNEAITNGLILIDSEDYFWKTKGFYIVFTIKQFLKMDINRDINLFLSTMLEIELDMNQEELPKVLKVINNNLSKSIVYNNGNILVKSELPRNFSFIDENCNIGGSGKVSDKYIGILENLGFTDIITLMENPIDITLKTNINLHHFPIVDTKPPTIEKMDKIINIMNQKNKKTLVHCLGGIGRTNTILACYMLFKDPDKLPSEVITYLKKNRVVKLTTEQVNFIKKYYGYLQSKDIKKSKSRSSKLIMLVGGPASGKTTLSMMFIKNHYDKVLHINQDDIGKKECIKLAMNNSKNNKTIILDRCNLKKDDRKEWMDIFHNCETECIFLNTPLEICKSRLSSRKNHPTLGNNDMSLKILEKEHKKLEKPSLSEGFKKIYNIRDEDDLKEVYSVFDLKYLDPDKMIKFPRTRHLCNLGASTKDDLVCNKNEVDNILKNRLDIEEKIDGANMGIFISKDKICIHNRSNFVNAKYHDQFKPLDKWIADHREDLYKILDNTGLILYGEWLVMKHSIHYDKLSDRFIVFDIYDRKKEKFYSREKVSKLLKDTNIKQVPLIHTNKIFKLDELKNLVNTKSIFYDGPVEGIYIRIYDSNNIYLKDRYKIVRSNFVSGNDKWKKGMFIYNEFE